MKIITSIIKLMTTWIAYWENTIISENSDTLPTMFAASISTAPIQ